MVAISRVKGASNGANHNNTNNNHRTSHRSKIDHPGHEEPSTPISSSASSSFMTFNHYKFASLLGSSLIGLLIFKQIPPIWKHSTSVEPSITSDRNLVNEQHSPCFSRFLQFVQNEASDTSHAQKSLDLLKGLSFIVHRNGEAESCGETTSNDFMAALEHVLSVNDVCPDYSDKYHIESLLTRLLHKMLPEPSSCHSVEPDASVNLGLYGFCDMGPEKTPILLDHHRLIANAVQHEPLLPCHFHTREGIRVTSITKLLQAASNSSKVESLESCSLANDSDGDSSCTASETLRTLHLYAVPAGRVFMFAPAYVGEIFPLPHVVGADPNQLVSLEVLSLSPRVFELTNFFTRSESQELIDKALKETRESHRIKRSSTGATGYNVNPKRTSESGYDTNGKTALEIMHRCFDVLGFDQFIESHADGLQMLRYNLTKSYNSHMDYIEGSDDIEYDFDSSRTGGNRFATILLYMTDLGEKDGGETVFTEAWPVGQEEKDHVDLKTAVKMLRDSGESAVLQHNSWEETMAALCRSRLSIRPRASRSVLFYSQHPNGQEDKSSLHGGCPVLAGTKYAANLWVWSAPRVGYPGSPKNPNFKGTSESTPVHERKSGKFENSGNNPEFDKAELYYEDTFWAKMGPNDPPIFVNTYEGNVWNVQVNGKVVKTWIIEKEKEYIFTL